ncbi:hypothetical protein TNCV_4641441 [Trichonephila clavipes]|nr:hypothetical protein TNCV_4641441 [Trichonephila clavipes]
MKFTKFGDFIEPALHITAFRKQLDAVGCALCFTESRQRFCGGKKDRSQCLSSRKKTTCAFFGNLKHMPNAVIKNILKFACSRSTMSRLLHKDSHKQNIGEIEEQTFYPSETQKEKFEFR